MQAVAVSDGRAFLTMPEKHLWRDDMSKVLPLGPRVSIASTGGVAGLFFYLGKTCKGQATFAAAMQETSAWFRNSRRAADMQALLFGFDEELRAMRLLAVRPSGWTEIYVPAPGVPRCLAMGYTDGMPWNPEAFAVADPLPAMREMARQAAAANNEIGPRQFEFLVQAPKGAVPENDPYRVWPRFDPEAFEARLKANPPAPADAILEIMKGKPSIT